MTKVKAGTFSALNVLTPSCLMTPLLIDYGLEASNPFDINAVRNVGKLTERLRETRPSIMFILVVLDSMSPTLTKKTKHKIKELKNVEEYIFHPGGNSQSLL